LRRSPYAWSLIDQGLSSGTTLLFTAIAARNLGPAGLGTVALGYAALLIAVGFERALIIDPLLTRIQTSARSAGEALRAAVSATTSGGLVLTLVAVAVGLSASGAGARGLLIFAPWVAPVLVHSLLKAWLYREERGGIATLSSAVWLAAMLLGVFAGLGDTDWQITAAWGTGACAALAVTAVGTRHSVRLTGPRATVAWVRHEALSIGLWRVASSMVFSAADYGRVAGISSILGPAAVGGYRAIETVFAPTSLIGPALTSSGLPPLRTSVEEQAARTWSLAVRISILGTALLVAYVVVVVLAKDEVIRIFGAEFDEYENLIPPMIVGQLLTGSAVGFGLLLAAARQVRELAFITVVHAVLMLGLALPLAAARGLEAAAWGIAAAELVPLVMVVVLARRVVTTFAQRPTPDVAGSDA